MANEDIEKLIVQFGARFDSFQREMLKLNGITDREARKIERRFQALNRNIAKALDARNLASGLGRLLSVAGIGLGTKEVIAYADAWTRSRAQLQVAGVELDRVGEKQQQLLEVANRSRTDFETIVSLYQRLGIASRELGTTQGDLTTITETLAKALQLGGASASEAQAAMLQFSQAVASGVLQGDELRSIRENAPLVAQAIADEFGVTVGQLKELGAAGELEGGRILKAILRVGAEINTEFEKLPQTADQSFTRLGNSVTALIGKLAEATGATAKLAGFFERLGDAVDLSMDKSLDARLKIVQNVIQTIKDANENALITKVPLLGDSFIKENLQRLKELQAEEADILRKINDQRNAQTSNKEGKGPLPSSIDPVTFQKLPGSDDKPKRDRVDEYAREVAQIRERTAALREEAQIVTDLTGKENDYGFALEKARAVRDLLNAAEAQGLTVTPALRAEIERLAEAQGRAAASADMARTGQQNWLQQQDDLRQKIEDQKDALVDTSVDFIGTFRDGILQGKSAVDSLNDSLSNLLSMLTDALLQEFMTRLIKGESGGGGDIVGALVNALPFAKGGIMTGHGSVPLKRYAKGGVANSPQLAMFGEGRRPEAYVPLPDGRSIPVKMQGGGGGGGVVVNIRNSSTGAVVRSGEARRRPDGRQEINLDVDDKIAAILNDPNSKSSQALDMRGARQPVVRRAR